MYRDGCGAAGAVGSAGATRRTATAVGTNEVWSVAHCFRLLRHVQPIRPPEDDVLLQPVTREDFV